MMKLLYIFRYNILNFNGYIFEQLKYYVPSGLLACLEMPVSVAFVLKYNILNCFSIVATKYNANNGINHSVNYKSYIYAVKRVYVSFQRNFLAGD